MQKGQLHIREFEANGERWQAARHPSLQHHPSRFVSRILCRAADLGVLFVSDSGERRFLTMTPDDFPSRTVFDSLTCIELVELLEQASSATE